MDESNKVGGVIAVLAAVGLVLASVGSEIRELMDWAEVVRPSFIGSIIMHIAAAIGAFVGGQMLPTMDALKRKN